MWHGIRQAYFIDGYGAWAGVACSCFQSFSCLLQGCALESCAHQPLWFCLILLMVLRLQLLNAALLWGPNNEYGLKAWAPIGELN